MRAGTSCWSARTAAQSRRFDYWYEVPGQAVNFLVKGGPGQRFGTIPLDELDIKETTRINRERGVEFKVAR
jgi:hypothetical protein